MATFVICMEYCFIRCVFSLIMRSLDEVLCDFQTYDELKFSVMIDLSQQMKLGPEVFSLQ